MKVNFIQLTLLSLAIILLSRASFAQQIDSINNQDLTIPLEKFVGYYQVGVKPNKPFFMSRWYLKEGKLFTIYDSDKDRELVPYQNGELSPTIFLSEKEVQVKEKDSTYYLVLNFEEEQLESFRVIRPRSEWTNDLYGYRIKQWDKYAIDTEKKLTYSYKTDHFEFECSPLDSAQIPELGNYLEDKYRKLLSDFEIDELPNTKIRIYPDYDSYHNAVLTPNAPKWQRGRAWNNDEIRMLSPITVKKETGEEVQLKNVVLHEFIHCLHLSLIKDGTRVPGWLWEGVAMYKGCCQWVENPTELDYLKQGKTPSLKQISNDSSFLNKFDLVFFIIKYLEEQFGWKKVLQLIHSNGQFKGVLEISEKDFKKKFYGYLEERYGKAQ